MKRFFTKAGWALCLSLFFSFSVYGQVEVEWERIYGGDHEDRLRSISVTADGGYLLGGDSRSGASGDKSEVSIGGEDFWVVKIDAEGNKVWDRTYGSEYIDYLFTVISLDDGGHLLAGRSFGDITDPLSGETNFRVIRIDADGDKLWDRTYGSMRGDYLNHAILTDDGGFLLTGTSAGTGGDRAEEPRGSNWDYWAVKIDAEGNLEWERGIAGFSIDYHQTVAQAADGGYLLGGFSASPARGDKSEGPKGYTVYTLPNGEIDSLPNNDYWVVKLDAAGNKMWDKTIGGTLNDHLYTIEATPDGGFLLGGSSESDASADKSADNKGENWWNTDMWIVKIDGQGHIEWDRTIGGSGSESLVIMEPVAGGGYLLGGNSDSPASGDKTEDPEEGQLIWLVWVDEQGNVLKDENMGRDGARLSAIASPSDHQYLLGGWIEGAETEEGRAWDDYYLLKIRDVADPGETPDPAPVPTTGLITGGGWFHSPAGAYEADPFAAGRAVFAINAQHKEGEEGARGTVIFIHREAGLRFYSRSVDWLSVNGNQAFIQGSGRIGMEEGYHFLVSVLDQRPGVHAQKDHFRMIIWDQEERIVYDSQRGEARYSGADRTIESGSITIHQQGKSHPAFAREQESPMAAGAIEGFRAYPAQLSGEGLWLEFPAIEASQPLQIAIYDIQGRKMAARSFETGEQGGKQLWKLDHEHWASGIYLLRVESHKLNHQQKLVK